MTDEIGNPLKDLSEEVKKANDEIDKQLNPNADKLDNSNPTEEKGGKEPQDLEKDKGKEPETPESGKDKEGNKPEDGKDGKEEPQKDNSNEYYGSSISSISNPNDGQEPLAVNVKAKDYSNSGPEHAGGLKTKYDHPDPDKYKDWMDACWKELVALYDYILNKLINTTLNLTDWALLSPLRGGTKDPKGSPELTPLEIGSAIYERKLKDLSKKKNNINKMHAEIISNIEKEKKGEPAVWEDKEPEIYKDLKKLNEEAEANPNSEAAKKWKAIVDAPKYMDVVYNNEAKIEQLACAYATYKEVSTVRNNSKEENKPENIEQRIRNDAQNMSKQIKENIEKIRATDASKIPDYIKFLSENINKAREGTEKAINKEKKAGKSVAKTVDNINNFEIDGKSLSEIEKPKETQANIFEKYLSSTNADTKKETNQLFTAIMTAQKGKGM